MIRKRTGNGRNAEVDREGRRGEPQEGRKWRHGGPASWGRSCRAGLGLSLQERVSVGLGE